MVRKFRHVLRWGTRIAVCAVLASTLPAAGHAAGWPKKAIQWVVVFSPAGDKIARAMKPHLHRDQWFLEAMERLAMFPFYKSPADARKHVLKEAEFYKTLVN